MPSLHGAYMKGSVQHTRHVMFSGQLIHSLLSAPVLCKEPSTLVFDFVVVVNLS